LNFTYDYLGRRIQKIVSTNNGTSYVAQYTNSFVYDGWNLAAILNNGTLAYSFVWGTDLSGSLQGAGGVGGLVSMTVYGGSNAGTYFYSYDGNGNVVALVNAANGTMVANYEYGPFGEVIRATGPMAKVNPFRFSTKYQDDETDFLYYGYRYYNPSTGRWIGRDPAGEDSGEINLYGFVCNAPVNDVDYLGLLQQQWIIDQINYPKSDVLLRQEGDKQGGRDHQRNDFWNSGYRERNGGRSGLCGERHRLLLVDLL
jgi:RHS repeat-associated protein